jgi:hypothetical protein
MFGIGGGQYHLGGAVRISLSGAETVEELGRALIYWGIFS